MSTPRFAALGWELSHPQILAADARSPESWNQAAAVFVSAAAIEQLWSGAQVDNGKRTFVSAADESQAWERVESLTRNLRRVLRRGGAVICRLDPPSQPCRVRRAPRSRCFPGGKRLTNYTVLSVVDPALSAWLMGSRGLRKPAAVDLAALSQQTAWHTYFDELSADLAPAVMLADGAGEPYDLLARDARGRLVGMVSGALALLPRLRQPQPEREAEQLVAAVEQAFLSRTPDEAPARRSLADCEALRRRERDLDQQIERLRRERDLVRRAIVQRESLESLLEQGDPARFAAAVAQALAILGLPAPTAEHGANGLIVEIDREQAASDPQIVVSGRVRRGNGKSKKNSAARERQPAVAPGGMPGSQPAGPARLVPANVLFDAAMSVLAHPEDESLRREARRSLASEPGAYRFAAADTACPLGVDALSAVYCQPSGSFAPAAPHAACPETPPPASPCG